MEQDEDVKLDKISTFLDAETPIQHEMQVKAPTQVATTEHSKDVKTNVEIDYDQVRSSMKDMIYTGTEVIEGLAKVAEESESPSAYEVLATTLKTIADMNKDLMAIHSDAQKLLNQSSSEPETVNNTQYVFNGSTEELQKILADTKK